MNANLGSNFKAGITNAFKVVSSANCNAVLEVLYCGDEFLLPG